MGCIFLIVGIIIVGIGIVTLFEELKIINENIAWGVLALIYGLLVSTLGYRIVQWIIKN